MKTKKLTNEERQAKQALHFEDLKKTDVIVYVVYLDCLDDEDDRDPQLLTQEECEELIKEEAADKYNLAEFETHFNESQISDEDVIRIFINHTITEL